MKGVDVANNDVTILIFKQRKQSHGFHLLKQKWEIEWDWDVRIYIYLFIYF